MGILSWIAVGLIAGWLAKQVVAGFRYGLLEMTVLGVAGGLLGGFVASTLFRIHDPITGFNLTTVLWSFAGAVALLVILRFLNGRRI